jgi:mRNA-degrading endonuclease RelE of RelBE toxin-antitoxin system
VRVSLAPQARRDLARLPEKAAGAVIETIDAIGANPRRLGKPLKLELADRWVARRGPYRIIYAIDDSHDLVVIETIGHREDVYRQR